jgi:hypothetical protein
LIRSVIWFSIVVTLSTSGLAGDLADVGATGALADAVGAGGGVVPGLTVREMAWSVVDPDDVLGYACDSEVTKVSWRTGRSRTAVTVPVNKMTNIPNAN